MSWGAQNRSKDAKAPSVGPAMSKKPELDRCPVQPYYNFCMYRQLVHNPPPYLEFVVDVTSGRAVICLLALARGFAHLLIFCPFAPC
jgi:hypothetical protein